MIRTVQAVIDEQGNIRLLEPVPLSASRRAVVLILDEQETRAPETALLTERSLAEDWNRPEEDAAWLHLQPEP